MSLPRCKHYLKKLEKFSVCALKAEKGWIGIEPEPDSFGMYHYVYYGTSKIGIPFKGELFTVCDNQFFSMKEHLHSPVMMETLEDFHMIGFNTLDKNEDWEGRMVTENILRVEKESQLICFDGNPIINGKELARFDYSEIYPNKDYEITKEGVLGLFTKL